MYAPWSAFSTNRRIYAVLYDKIRRMGSTRGLRASNIGILAASLLVSVAVLSGCGDESSRPDAAGDAGSITGTAEDWLQAVCVPGKYRDGVATSSGIFNGSLGGGLCFEGVTGSEGGVFFTQWDSNFKMRNAMELARMCYASAIDESGMISTFSVSRNKANSGDLEPLTQFGFTNTC